MKELKLLKKVEKLVLEKMEEEQLKMVALKLKEVEEVVALKEQPQMTRLQLAERWRRRWRQRNGRCLAATEG